MRNNKEKVITIAALVIAVIGLSIGFAAFASTLNISTSASVTPADGNFIVKFSKVNNELNEEDVTPSTGTGDAADIDNTNASNPKIGTLSTTFTQPGQSVEYTFYVRNMGKYDAYLTNIRFNNASTGNSFKVCTATSDNPVSNANDMCQYITYRLTLEDSPSNKVLTSTSDFATTVGNSYYVAKSADPTTGTTNSKMVKVTITYEDGSPFADGAFTVNFGSVELVFASLAGYVPQQQPIVNGTTPASCFVSIVPGQINDFICNDTNLVIPDNLSLGTRTASNITFDSATCSTFQQMLLYMDSSYTCANIEIQFNSLKSNPSQLYNTFLGAFAIATYGEESSEKTAITTIQDAAFAGHPFNSVTIGEGITTLGLSEFPGTNLSSVTFPSTLTSIAGYSFWSDNLASVTIPSSVTTIGPYAFGGNIISTLNLSGNNLSTIGHGAFYGNSLTSVTIPASVTSIGDDAFSVNLLSSVTLQNGLQTIGEQAFRSNRLSSVTIPNSVTSIGESAFAYNNLTTIVIGTGVTNFGLSPFGGTTSDITTLKGSQRSYGSNQITSVTINAPKANIGGSGIGVNTFTYDSNANCTNTTQNDYSTNTCIIWVNG